MIILPDGSRVAGVIKGERSPVTVTTASGRTFTSTWGAVLAQTNGEAARLARPERADQAKQWVVGGIQYRLTPPARTWSVGGVSFKAAAWREILHPRDRRGRFARRRGSGGSGAPSASGKPAPQLSPPSGSATTKPKKITEAVPSFGRTHRKILEQLGWAKGKEGTPPGVQQPAAALLAKQPLNAPEINTLAIALRMEADKPHNTPTRRESILRGAARMQAAAWRIDGISAENVPNDNLGAAVPGNIQAGDKIAIPGVGGTSERFTVITAAPKYGMTEMIVEDAGGARQRRFLSPGTDAYYVPDLMSGPSASTAVDDPDLNLDPDLDPDPEPPAPKAFTGPKAEDMKLGFTDKPIALYDHPGQGGGKTAKKLEGPGAVLPAGRWYDTLAVSGADSDPIPVDGLTIEGHVVKDGLAFRRNGISYLVEKAPGESDEQALARANKNADLLKSVLDSVPEHMRHHQRGMALLQASNPADALWEQKYGIPGFHSDATGGHGGITIWGGQDPKPTTLAHEFGHNVDSALYGVEKWLSDTDAVLIDGQHMPWMKAALLDEFVSAFHQGDFKETRLHPFVKPIQLNENGVTEYGAAGPREDFAESVRLWLKDRRENRVGYKPSTGENVRFADLFPERALILDAVFGTTTNFDTPIRKRLRKEQDEKFLENLKQLDGDPAWPELSPNDANVIKAAGLTREEVQSSYVRAKELFAKHKKEQAAKKAAEEAAKKLEQEKAAAAAQAKADVASIKAALAAGKLEAADASKLRRRVRAYRKKLRDQGHSEAEVAQLSAAWETEELHKFLGLDAPAEPWLKALSTPDFNTTENVIAHEWVKQAGTTVHPHAKDQFGVAQQAKANIMAELADRILSDPQALETWKQYKIKEGLSASAIEAMSPAALRERIDTDVSHRVAKWASTSGDSDPHAVLMQEAIRQEFKTSGNPAPRTTKKEFNDWMETYWDNVGDWYRTVARVMYQHTQEEFKKEGITHISVYRGMGFTPSKAPKWATPGVQRVHLQPVNSWSSNLTTSKGFTSAGSQKIIISARVPVELVLGSARTGLGCLNEFEFVIFDNDGEVKVDKYAYGY